MIRLLFIITIFQVIIYSCSSKKQKIQPLKVDDRLSCFKIEPKAINYIPESIIGIYYLTNGKDTLYPKELFFSDSTRFTQSFKDIKVPDICIEANWQGKTFYSVQINDTGGFHDFKVVRMVSKVFQPYDEKVEQKLAQMKLISSEFFNRELIFYHKFSVIKTN